MQIHSWPLDTSFQPVYFVYFTTKPSVLLQNSLLRTSSIKHQYQQRENININNNKMGCMSSKAVPQEEEIINAKPMPQIVRYFDPIELQFLEIELTTTQSWPTKCYRNPGVLPATLAIGYPYPYPDGYPNTPPPFPIPSGVRGIENEKFMNCGRSHGMRRREGEPRTS